MAAKPDIAELFGLEPTDAMVADRMVSRRCPFTDNRCSKIERGSSAPTGVCAVTAGSSKSPVVICRERVDGDWFAMLRLAASECFGAPRFITGGSKLDMANRLSEARTAAVVGHRNVKVVGKQKLEFDWILQHYEPDHKLAGFAAVQNLTMDISGSYRSALEAYRDLHGGRKDAPIPPSQHSVVWTNIQKKIIPDIIRRGLVLAEMDQCWGNYLLVDETTYARMEPAFAEVPEHHEISAQFLSVRVYAADRLTASGVRIVRSVNLGIKDIATAFYAKPDEKAGERLTMALRNML